MSHISAIKECKRCGIRLQLRNDFCRDCALVTGAHSWSELEERLAVA